jgi:hypothetical protein
MPLYAVRLIKDKSAIGLIYAETTDQLFFAVAEIVREDYCEYREIGVPAAIFFEGESDERSPWKLGTKDGPLANMPDPANYATDLAYKQRMATIGQSMNFAVERNPDLRDVMMGDIETDGWQLLELNPLDQDE